MVGDIGQCQIFEGWAGRIPDDATYELLHEYARYMRNNPTFAEKCLWDTLRREQLSTAKLRRQHIIGRFIVDFYCAQTRLIIEVDGSSHDDKAEYDAQRTQFLEGLGLQVIRFSNDEVIEHPVPVLKTILSVLAKIYGDPLP